MKQQNKPLLENYAHCNRLIFCCLFILFFLPAFGQDISENSNIRFRSSLQLGALSGKEPVSFQVQAINGIGYKNFAVGVGVGLDYYFVRTVPIFINVQQAFLSGSHSPFVYGSYGTQVPWMTNAQKQQHSGLVNISSRNYYDAGIGYQLPVWNDKLVTFSVGLSNKRISETMPSPCCTYNFIQNEFDLLRVSLKAGIVF